MQERATGLTHCRLVQLLVGCVSHTIVNLALDSQFSGPHMSFQKTFDKPALVLAKLSHTPLFCAVPIHINMTHSMHTIF